MNRRAFLAALAFAAGCATGTFKWPEPPKPCADPEPPKFTPFPAVPNRHDAFIAYWRHS